MMRPKEISMHHTTHLPTICSKNCSKNSIYHQSTKKHPTSKIFYTTTVHLNNSSISPAQCMPFLVKKCPKLYIGETKRSTATRIKEEERSIKLVANHSLTKFSLTTMILAMFNIFEKPITNPTFQKQGFSNLNLITTKENCLKGYLFKATKEISQI